MYEVYRDIADTYYAIAKVYYVSKLAKGKIKKQYIK